MTAALAQLCYRTTVSKQIGRLVLCGMLAAPLFGAAQTDAQKEAEPQAVAAWAQSTFYTGFNMPRALALDTNGNVYVADWGNNRIVKVAANGKSSTPIANVTNPTAVAVDLYADVVAGYATPAGTAPYVVTLVVDNEPKTFQKSTLMADGPTAPTGLAFCGLAPPAGSVKDPILYTSGLAFGVGSDSMIGVSDFVGNYTGPVVVLPGFATRGLACDAAGNLYIVDGTFYKVWKLTPKGVWSSIGSGYNRPEGVAVDEAGNVFVADFGNNRVVEVTPGGVETVFGTGLAGPTGIAIYNGKSEQIFVADSGNNRIVEFEE